MTNLTAIRPYIKIVSVTLSDMESTVSEKHYPLHEIGLAYQYMRENEGNYDLLKYFIMHSDLLTDEDFMMLEQSGIEL